jgi:hypothetical protein
VAPSVAPSRTANLIHPSSLGLPVGMALPSRWELSVDSPDLFVLTLPLPQGDYLGSTPLYSVVGFYRGPVANLGLGTQETPPKIARQFANWMHSLRFLRSSAPTPVTLGGRPGFRLDVSLADGSPTATCNAGHGACEALLTSKPADRFEFGLVLAEKARLFFLDMPDKSVLLVTIDAASGTDFNRVVRVAQPVIDSVTFEAG